MHSSDYNTRVAADHILQVKRSHLAVTNSSGDVLFPFTPGKMTGARYGRIRYRLLSLVNGARSVREIHRRIADGTPGGDHSLHDIIAVLQRLVEEGILEIAPQGEPCAVDRYSRQRLFFGSFAEDGIGYATSTQKILGEASVAIFGAGGVGTHVLYGLIAAGVGKILVVDGDRVSVTNLNRQLFYTKKDIGVPKVEVLQQRCPALNDEIDYTFVYDTITDAGDLADAMGGCDLAVLSADTPRDQIFRWSQEAAADKQTPVLYCLGLFVDTITVGPLYIPGSTSCFNCFYPATQFCYSPSDFTDINAAYQHGSFVSHIGIMGQIVALEVIKHLTGFKACQVYDRVLRINLSTYEFEAHPPRIQPCSWCGDSKVL